MRSIIYFSGILLIVSCAGNSGEELEKCRVENGKLLGELQTRDSAMASITHTYTEIDSVSKIIETKKAYIHGLAKKGKLSRADKEAVRAHMDTIVQLMNENKERVASLQMELEAGGLDDEMKFMLEGMDDKNELEVAQLGNMKKDLAQVSKDFNDLFEEYVYKEVENLEMREQLSEKEQELVAAEQRLEAAKEKLQSGWYVIGTKEELTAKGLIFKKGFFDNKAVNEDFDKSQFKKVNIYDLKEVILDSRSADMITTHPSEAYETLGMKKKVNKLVIKNPDLFWSVSKFLIIEIEK